MTTTLFITFTLLCFGLIAFCVRGAFTSWRKEESITYLTFAFVVFLIYAAGCSSFAMMLSLGLI